MGGLVPKATHCMERALMLELVAAVLPVPCPPPSPRRRSACSLLLALGPFFALALAAVGRSQGLGLLTLLLLRSEDRARQSIRVMQGELNFAHVPCRHPMPAACAPRC